LTTDQGVVGSNPTESVVLIKTMNKIKGDCTWSEQFGYIWLCVREIIKMQIEGDNYQPSV
jgi:hypothetical protein